MTTRPKVSRTSPTVVDLFAGIGGLSEGFRAAGCRIVAGVEKDPSVASYYELNQLPSTATIKSSLETLDGKSLLSQIGLKTGELDFVVAGPPCQGYSTIGKRRKNDPRNRLIMLLPPLLKQVKSKAFLIENVPGLLELDGGRTIEALLNELVDAGFHNSRYELVEASACGVPQRRKRVIIFGSRSAASVNVDDLKGPSGATPTVWEAIADLPDPSVAMKLAKPGEAAPYGSPSQSPYAVVLRERKRLVTGWEPVLHCKKITDAYAETEPGTTEPETRCWRLDADGQSRTLRAGSRTRTACRPIHPFEPRVITVREAARLHSFRDSLHLPPTKSAAHMVIGNAVPPLMAKTLATRLIPFVSA